MTWIDLYFSCPACIAQGRNAGAPTNWYHANCGGQLQISETARVRCNKTFLCGEDRHISSWSWGCPNHGDPNRAGYYQKTNANSVAAQISVSGAMINKSGKRWMLKFLDNLGEW